MVVPDELRSAVSAVLAALVRGDFPDQMLWVRQYGNHGAVLVAQPDEIWDHRHTQVTEVRCGGWLLASPLWTTDESPSDLSVEIAVSPMGEATLVDVHVL